jgi:hypothetical protein
MAAFLNVLRASWNSPTSAKSGSPPNGELFFELDTLLLQLLRLNNLMDSLVEDGLASSTQPFAVTNPHIPIEAIS